MHDLHKNPFDDGTTDKLVLYREYLRAWLPTFIHSEHADTLQVFDFFAGPGQDVGGSPGSPIITCKEVRLALSGAKTEKTPAIKKLTDAYYRWLPKGKRYFIAPFSIRKGANVYGLVFGSAHPRGIDKFLRIAWKLGGDANFDIDDDRIDPSAPFIPGFDDLEKPSKVKVFENALKRAFQARELLTNKDVFEFALRHGVLAEHARSALTRLIHDQQLPKQTLHISYDAWRKKEVEPILFCQEEKR